MPDEVLRAARYMTRFRCLGGECEDTCCAGWTVTIDQPTHRRLTLLSAHEPTTRQLLEEGIELTPSGPDFGHLRFSDSGDCSMLQQDGLCAIHARLGPDALFDVCLTYPRYFNEIDGELELFGTVSCPEVARACLLVDDALELERIEGAEPPRKLRNQLRTEKPFFQPFLLVRGALSELLFAPEHALSQKLFIALWVSDQLKAVLHAGASAVPLEELKQLFGGLREPALRSALAETQQALRLDGELAFSVIARVLRPPSAPTARPGARAQRFDEVLGDTWSAYGLAPGSASELSDAQLHDVWAQYRERRERVPESARLRLEACLTRYAVNHLYATPYMLYPSLFAYTSELVLRVAMLRFLLSTRLAGFEGDPGALDRAIVDVVYSFGRRVEHSDLFARLARQLEQQGLSSFAHSVGFLGV